MRRGKRGNSRWRRKRGGDAKTESRGGTWRAMRGAAMGGVEGEIGRVEWAAMAASEGFQSLLAAVAVP